MYVCCILVRCVRLRVVYVCTLRMFACCVCLHVVYACALYICTFSVFVYVWLRLSICVFAFVYVVAHIRCTPIKLELCITTIELLWEDNAVPSIGPGNVNTPETEYGVCYCVNAIICLLHNAFCKRH